jgi:M6 family metalloprotease-like protein
MKHIWKYFNVGILLFMPVISDAGICFQLNPRNNSFAEPEPVSISGGYSMPSEGTLNVLFIFAKFPDDNYSDPKRDSCWPRNGWPVNVNINGWPQNIYTWVDSVWTGNPTPYSMTDYFNQMSLGKLKFIGKVDTVTAPHSRQWYLDKSKSRYFIHKDIIQEENERRKFTEFDNWRNISAWKNKNEPDGKVDLICFIWRNIAMEYPTKKAQDSINKKLDMGRFGSIARGENYFTDTSGIRKEIAMGDNGSGVTVINYFYQDVFRFSIHEIAHHLLGGNSYHNGHGFWAMLSGYEVRSYMINSYERNKLGWGTIERIDNKTKTLYNKQLPDFITTGKAYMIDIDSSKNQFFYLENHQRISWWDVCSVNDPNEKGIYVLRQDREYSSDGNSAHWMHIVPAEGRFNWEVKQMAYPDYYPSGIPVYKKLDENRDGYHSLEYVPYFYKGKKHVPFEIIFLEDPVTGKPIEHPTRYGDGKDAFRIGYNEVFSPWSNPNSQKADGNPTGIGFKIKSFNPDSNSFDINIYFNTSEAAPPSKPINFKVDLSNANPVFSWTRNIEPDLKGYILYRKLKTASGEETITKWFTTDTTFSDSEININQSLINVAEYWLTAADKDNNVSVETRHYIIK